MSAPAISGAALNATRLDTIRERVNNSDHDELYAPAYGDRRYLLGLVDEGAELLRAVSALVSAPVNRFGKPEFYSPEEMAAREYIRTLAVHFGVAPADTVLHQAGAVIRAALAKVSA